jgi:hypothetical protein
MYTQLRDNVSTLIYRAWKLEYNYLMNTNRLEISKFTRWSRFKWIIHVLTILRRPEQLGRSFHKSANTNTQKAHKKYELSRYKCEAMQNSAATRARTRCVAHRVLSENSYIIIVDFIKRNNDMSERNGYNIRSSILSCFYTITFPWSALITSANMASFGMWYGVSTIEK